MSKITYSETRTGSIKVKLDGKYVGSIVQNSFARGGEMWHYQPKGTCPPGDSFYSIAAVKRSLETL